jgi:cytochrome c oxidase subunit 3
MTGHAITAEHVHGHHEVAPGDPPHIHHMDSKTAYGAAKLGMWLFLGTEILLFAVMFCSFAIMRYYHLAEFHDASNHLNLPLGALNTVILLISSFTAAVGVTRAQQNSNRGVVINFGISIVCGLAFLVIKTIEYTGKAHHGMFPFSPWNANFYEYKNFLGIYYCMTGLHALHVIIGMIILGWVALKASNNRFSERYYTPVELGALYWHLVDLIWIYLFPLLYLVG